MSDPVASPSLSRLGVKNQVPLETESVANKKTTIKGCNYQLGELAGNYETCPKSKDATIDLTVRARRVFLSSP